MNTRYVVDTNVVLDLILGRKPFDLDALHIFSLAEAEKVKLLVSSDAITTIYYVVAKNKNEQVARQAIATLLDYVSLISFDERCVLQGLSFEFTDFEDALVSSVAIQAGARAIITRNIKDFKNSAIPVLSPKEFIAFQSQSFDD